MTLKGILPPNPITLIPLAGLKLIQPKDDIGRAIYDACLQTDFSLQSRDILVIAQTIVSRAEGRIVNLADIIPSPRAKALGLKLGKSPALVETILRSSVRVLRAEQGHLIVETHHGLVCANAGVDTSNAPGENMVTLLPEDPDNSAQRIRNRIHQLHGVDVAVLISDTHGRPFRRGAINIAIGASGLAPLKPYIGRQDLFGYKLRTTRIAVADELASAAELLMGEADEGIAVVVVRNYSFEPAEETAKILVRNRDQDLFRR